MIYAELSVWISKKKNSIKEVTSRDVETPTKYGIFTTLRDEIFLHKKARTNWKNVPKSYF